MSELILTDTHFPLHRNNDVTSWQQQILAPPNELISTPQLEFVLGDLVPDTEYRVKVMVQLRDLHNSPSSPVLTVRTMAPGKFIFPQEPLVIYFHLCYFAHQQLMFLTMSNTRTWFAKPEFLIP